MDVLEDKFGNGEYRIYNTVYKHATRSFTHYRPKMANVKTQRVDAWKMYDVDPQEMRAIQERARMRDALKQEFLKKSYNPYTRAEKGYIVSVV